MGQVLGTSVGTDVFIKYGWRASAALSLGWYGWQVVILLIRGPHCQRYTWFGYEGGLEGRKSVLEKRGRDQVYLEKVHRSSSSDQRAKSNTDSEEGIIL